MGLFVDAPLFILGIPDGKAMAAARSRIKQFLAISLTGKVVVPCPVMAMLWFLFLCEGVANAHAWRRLQVNNAARSDA